MSTSLLCHGFGIRGYRHVRVTFEGAGDLHSASGYIEFSVCILWVRERDPTGFQSVRFWRLPIG